MNVKIADKPNPTAYMVETYYDLGLFVSEYQFMGGIQNVTKKVTTTTGEYVVKNYQRSSGDAARLAEVLRIIQLLHQAGAPIPHIVPTQDKKLFVPIEDSSYYAFAVTEFLNGVLIFYDDIDLSHAQEAGRALAALHEVIEGLDTSTIKLPSALEVSQRINVLSTNLEDYFSNNYLKLNPSLLESLRSHWLVVREALLELNTKNIQQNRVIHGDFIRGNLLFEDSKICGILDFDAMRCGSFDEDVSGAVFQWFWDERKMFAYEDMRDAIMAGYCSQIGASSCPIEVSVVDRFVLLIAWEKMATFMSRPKDDIQLSFHESLFNELKEKLFLLSGRLSYN